MSYRKQISYLELQETGSESEVRDMRGWKAWIKKKF